MTKYFDMGRNLDEQGELYVKPPDSDEWVQIGEVTLAMLQWDNIRCRYGINPGTTASTDDSEDYPWPTTKVYVPDWKPPKGVRRIRIKKREK